MLAWVEEAFKEKVFSFSKFFIFIKEINKIIYKAFNILKLSNLKILIISILIFIE